MSVGPQASNKRDAWIALMKRNNITNSFKADSHHIFQDWKIQEERKKRENPKIHPEAVDYHIDDNQRTNELREGWIKFLLTTESKRKKKTFIKSLTR